MIPVDGDTVGRNVGAVVGDDVYGDIMILYGEVICPLKTVESCSVNIF